MPFGILECKKMEVVPGTAFMSDQDDLPPEFSNIPRERLKHGTGRFKDVILVPQPSDSPNDPLNVSHSPQTKTAHVLVIHVWFSLMKPNIPVAAMEKRTHPRNRRPLRSGSRRLRPDALPGLCRNLPKPQHHRRDPLAGHGLADLHVGHGALRDEPASKTPWSSADFHNGHHRHVHHQCLGRCSEGV